MHRYGNIDFANKLTIKTFSQIINKAEEENTKEYLYRMYLALLPNFDKKTYMTFNQFYEKHKPKPLPKLDRRSEDELMDEIMLIEELRKR